MKRAGYVVASCLLLWSAALSALPRPAHAQRDPQVRVELSADKTELPVNDNVTVRIYVQAQGSGQPDIEVPEFDGFQIVQRAVQRPMQFSFGFGNSQPVMTSTTQYTFVLVPMGAGTFKIPPVKVSFGQRVFQSKPLVLTVTGASATQPPVPNAQQQPSAQNPPRAQGDPAAVANAPSTPAPQASGDVAIFDNEAFLRTVVDKLEPYEGEQVTSTIYLYARHNLQQVPAVQTEASTDGLWVQDLLSATRALEPTRQVINGRGFWVYTLRRFAAFPLRSGELTIGSMALTISRESLFDLFDPQRGGPSELQRRSVPVLLHVKPLPAENRPTGPIAVGNFEIKTGLDRSQVATGDAVTWTATLHGRGNLRGVKLADPAVNGLQILQPEVRDLTESPGDRVQTTRSFAWLVVPQVPGAHHLPA
ncbi:MAG: BatD family protein, partial [Polyangiales bacterium]